MEQVIDISGLIMNFIQQVEIHGHIGMLEIGINLLLHSVVLVVMYQHQQFICLDTLLLHGNNLFIIMMIKVNVDAVLHVVEMVLVVVILVVVVVIYFFAVVLIVVVIIVVGIIVVMLVVVDGIIVGEHLLSQEEVMLNLLTNIHSFLQLVLI